MLLLAAMAGIAQFAAGVYTPSLPAIARSLGTDVSSVQLTLAIFLAALGAGQLVFGPLADRFGRRPVLVGGFGLFLAGTLACALSPDIETLLCARAFQGFGAASPVVVARAAARDSFDGAQLARLMALVVATFAVVPGISPVIGAAAHETGGWRASFWLTLCVGAIILAYILLKLPETGKFRLARLDMKSVGDGFRMIARDRAAAYGIFSSAMAFGTVAAFNAGAPTLYIEHLGVSPAEFSLYPFLSVAAIVTGSLYSRRLANMMPASGIAGRGIAFMIFGLVLMLAFPATGVVHKHLFSGTLAIYSAGFGLLVPTVNSMVLSRFSENVGFVSATLGFLLLSGAALGATVVSLAQTMLPIPALPLTMLILAVAAAAPAPAYFVEMKTRVPPSND